MQFFQLLCKSDRHWWTQQTTILCLAISLDQRAEINFRYTFKQHINDTWMLPFRKCNIFRMSISAKVQQNVHYFQSIGFHCQKIYNEPNAYENAKDIQ